MVQEKMLTLEDVLKLAAVMTMGCNDFKKALIPEEMSDEKGELVENWLADDLSVECQEALCRALQIPYPLTRQALQSRKVTLGQMLTALAKVLPPVLSASAGSRTSMDTLCADEWFGAVPQLNESGALRP